MLMKFKFENITNGSGERAETKELEKAFLPSFQ